MKFDAFISSYEFGYIIPELQKSGILKSLTMENKIRKTASFYGENFNVYIDGSDGHASEYGTGDPCERILWVVKDTGDKPFLFFKNWYSPSMCVEIEKVASENNGTVIPFMYWGQFPYFQSIFNNRNSLSLQNKNTTKTVDIGIPFEQKNYYDPKRSKFDSRMSWKGYGLFGHGPEVDTGMNEHSLRISIVDKIKNQNQYTYEHIFGVPWNKMLDSSMKWKLIYDIPGVSSVTHRMFEFGWLGKCVVLTKNDIDFPYSWKDYYPEINYNSDTWEDDLGEILENHEKWGDGIKYYLETYCTPEVIVNYMIEKIDQGVSER